MSKWALIDRLDEIDRRVQLCIDPVGKGVHLRGLAGTDDDQCPPDVRFEIACDDAGEGSGLFRQLTACDRAAQCGGDLQRDIPH